MPPSAATSSAIGRVASTEYPRMNSVMVRIASAPSSFIASATVFMVALSVPPPRDHEGFVVEPEAAALLQDLAGGVEIASVGHHVAQPVVLDLRDVDRGVP